MRLLVATTNAGKLREIRDVLAGLSIELVTLADLPRIEEPEETGTTFEENARLKALYYAAHAGVPTVAEDSGLVIDAMNGEPGVLSARFLGAGATYPERFAEIERRLAAAPGSPRTARFVCALACVSDGDVIFQTTQTVEGEIADRPRGDRGFGYDPIFWFPPYAKTLAEVTQEEKIRVAHRGKAFRTFADWLRRAQSPACTT